MESSVPQKLDNYDVIFKGSKTASHSKNTRLLPILQAESPYDFFEEPMEQLDRFDRMVEKKGIRKFKYPRIELQRISQFSQ